MDIIRNYITGQSSDNVISLLLGSGGGALLTKGVAKWLIMVLFWFLYWGICFLCTGTDKKNLAGLRSYPDEVQKRVREKLPDIVPKEKSFLSIMLGNLILFTVVFSVFGLIFKSVFAFDGYLSAFLYFLVLGEGLGLFDLVVIDLLWWRNTKRIRFSFLPEKEIYQNPDKHIDSFVRGIPLFAVIAALTALIVTML